MLQQRMALTNPQYTIYNEGWTDEARFRTAVCGRRFGKTFLSCEEIRRACVTAVRNNVDTDNEIWYGAPTKIQAKKNMWKRLKKTIPREWIKGKPNETECVIELKSGHVIRIVGLDNSDNLRGSGLWFFVGDEWADVKPGVWDETIRPMLATAQGHALFIGTPKGFNEFYDFHNSGYSTDPINDGWATFVYTTVDGGNVSESEIQNAMRKLNSRSFRQEYQASFETYAGRVMFAFNRKVHVIECEYDPALDLHVGMDFNVNPMSATIWQVGAKNISYQIDELIIPTSNTTEMILELIAKYPKHAKDRIHIYPDAAGHQRKTSAVQGTTDITQLEEAGFDVRVDRSNPQVRDRYNTVNGQFMNTLNEISAYVSRDCEKSIEAYEKLTYKEGTNIPDKLSGFDHVCDATGYFMFYLYGSQYDSSMDWV